MITVLPEENGTQRYMYNEEDIRKLRSYVASNNGRISAALSLFESEGKLEGLSPAAMIQVIRFAERTITEPEWCSEEQVEALKKKNEQAT